MKILLFNLGTIEHRINAWGADGFHSLFENDVILWGPIPDNEFVFKGKNIPILKIHEQTSINAVFEKLPDDWYPDIVSCDTSVLSYVPDIHLCPVKTILFTRDSWSDALFNRGLAESFDFLNSSTIDRDVYKELHVSLLPLTGFAVSTPEADSKITEFESRNIDVIAIANYDNSFYHERYKAFYNLSASNENGLKIEFVRSIKRSEIYNYYQRSKIVVDWAHTLSNRSYEAALNGCLLFSHEDNSVLSDFWTPWEEYIPYNESNFYKLITYYLNNPELSKSVIRKAQLKVKSISKNWGEMVQDKITMAFMANDSVQNRIKYNKSLPATILNYRSATPLLYNYDYNTSFPSDWRDMYFTRIDKAISVSENPNQVVSPLIEAARVAFLLGRTEPCLKYLAKLITVQPEYAWTYYLFGRIYFVQNDYERAHSSLQKALECANMFPHLLQQYVLPVIEKRNACDGRRITSFMWQSTLNHNNEFQVKALQNLALELIGELFERTGKHQEAITAYVGAVNMVPIPGCIYKLSPLLIESKTFDILAESTYKGITDSPYDSIVVLYNVYALIQLKQKRNALRVLRAHQKALKSFVGIRLITLIRVSIYIIIPLIFVGRQPVSKAILEIIKILKKKAEVSYLS